MLLVCSPTFNTIEQTADLKLLFLIIFVVHSVKTFSRLAKVFIGTFVADSPSTLQTSQTVII